MKVSGLYFLHIKLNKLGFVKVSLAYLENLWIGNYFGDCKHIMKEFGLNVLHLELNIWDFFEYFEKL